MFSQWLHPLSMDVDEGPVARFHSPCLHKISIPPTTLTLFPRRRVASVPKASAAALRLPMAVTRARGGLGALYITLAGSPELGATSARSKWVLALAAGRDQNSADLRGSCIARSPLLVSFRRSGRYNITTRAPYRYFYRPSTFRGQHGCPLALVWHPR